MRRRALIYGLVRAAAASVLLLSSGAALAQALSCTIPSRLASPGEFGPNAAQPSRRLPIGGYTLALSWSPQHCREQAGEESFQCDSANRFGFVVHGLWPDGRGVTWPQYCRPAKPVPQAVIRRHLCMTPSVELLQHEWARHGTCMTAEPARYFDSARGAFEQLRFPDMAALSRREDLTVGAFRRAFAEANRHIPGFTERSVRVRMTRARWLDEVWLCLDTRLAYGRCGPNQSPGHSLEYRMKIWRGG